MPLLVAPDGTPLRFDAEDVLVGRGSSDGQFKPDIDLGGVERATTVSRRHARIYRRRGGWFLSPEPNATNATSVAGQPLSPGREAALEDGAQIQLGAVPLVFRVLPKPDGVLPPEPTAELRVGSMVFPLVAAEGEALGLGRSSVLSSGRPDIDLGGADGGRTVSRRHGWLIRADGRWRLRVEPEATNRTLVAGRGVSADQDVVLTDGCRLQLGRLLATFHERQVARDVGPDVIDLIVEPASVRLEAGGEQHVSLTVVNGTGRVEQFQLRVDGIPQTWYRVAAEEGVEAADGRVALLDSARSTRIAPEPGAIGHATLIFCPPRQPDSRAGTYPIAISATTEGDERLRRVVAGELTVLPYEALQARLEPAEGRGRFQLELSNGGNAPVSVDVQGGSEEVRCKPEQAEVDVANGAQTSLMLAARPRHRHWLGPTKTLRFQVSTHAGSHDRAHPAELLSPPRIPLWLQTLLARVSGLLGPVLVPVASVILLAVLLGGAYVFARPQVHFAADHRLVAEGSDVRLRWTTERASEVHLAPQDQTLDPQGSETVKAPTGLTEYTLVAHSWLPLWHVLPFLSTEQKVSVQAVHFGADHLQLAKEGEEVKLDWNAGTGATVQIDPPDALPPPASNGEAKVHPPGEITYKLTATSVTGEQVEVPLHVTIGQPTITDFGLIADPQRPRIYPGDPIQFSWKASGVTRLVLRADTGPVLRGQTELEVGDPPVPLEAPPTATTYSLIGTSAGGSAHAEVRVEVSPPSISGFDAQPNTVVAGGNTQLSWRIEGANATTHAHIDPEIGGVDPIGNTVHTAVPLVDTTYVLTVETPAGILTARRPVTVLQPTPVPPTATPVPPTPTPRPTPPPTPVPPPAAPPAPAAPGGPAAPVAPTAAAIATAPMARPAQQPAASPVPTQAASHSP